MIEKVEIWKDVKGYEGYYQISNLGNIKNIKYLKTKKCNNDLLLKLKPCKHKGYVKVTLQKDGQKEYYLVHRIVAEHFIPNDKNKATVNHKNGIKYDNSVGNLEWATYSENMQHAFDEGYKVPTFRDGRKSSKLNSDDIFAIKILIKRGITNIAISELFNVSASLISSVRKGKSK
tara:strand:- start:69 stop:593 length:525 start_codon:yes stop_codon:yes gene_type:complete